MDLSETDPHITRALLCIIMALMITVMVHAQVIVDHGQEIIRRAQRDKKPRQK
jgi:hypothetical protein